MQRYLNAISFLPPFEQLLRGVPSDVMSAASEIRIRADKPLVVFTGCGSYVCGMRKATTDELFRCIQCFCDYSLYSHEKELYEGFFTLRGGHRASFAGTSVYKSGRRESIRDFSSVCLRIAREHKGVAQPLFDVTANAGDMRGLLILGPPLSAKTTLLRDYCRLIARSSKTAVIDERGEIAAVHGGVPENDIGLNSDVLTGFSKADGIEHAVRLLSPDYLVCDEIGRDYKELFACSGRGIIPVLTAHCKSAEDIPFNEAVCGLLHERVVNYVAFVCGSPDIGRIKGVWKTENEACIRFDDCNNLLLHRKRDFAAKKAARYAIEPVSVNA